MVRHCWTKILSDKLTIGSTSSTSTIKAPLTWTHSGGSRCACTLVALSRRMDAPLWWCHRALSFPWQQHTGLSLEILSPHRKTPGLGTKNPDLTSLWRQFQLFPLPVFCFSVSCLASLYKKPDILAPFLQISALSLGWVAPAPVLPAPSWTPPAPQCSVPMPANCSLAARTACSATWPDSL